MKFNIFNSSKIEKLLSLSIIFFLISCGAPENCETEIIEGLVYKNDKLYTGKCIL